MHGESVNIGIMPEIKQVPVTLVIIQINDHEFLTALQSAKFFYGNGRIINQAEALAFIRMCMMVPAAKIKNRQVPFKAEGSCHKRTSSNSPEIFKNRIRKQIHYIKI